MIDVCLLGCGGSQPLPGRHLTSLMLRCNGSSLLIDCGEGTQVAIKKVGWTFKPIDVIALTHFHGDHTAGLPGLLLTMGGMGRTEPLTIIGPKGTERIVSALRVIAPELPFQIRVLEIEGDNAVFSLEPGNIRALAGEEDRALTPYRLTAFKVKHSVTCYGYKVELDRAGRFDVERAKAGGVPMKVWSRLQKGETIEQDGRVFTPDMVMGPPRKGLKVTYVTDTRPVSAIEEQAQGSDLFICEGMYGDPDKLGSAKEKRHMMITEAAALALNGHVRRLWLTHYSPSMARPDQYLGSARNIFPETYLGKDGKMASLDFEED